MGNGWGSYSCTREKDMRVYDLLPRDVRDILKYTVGDWASPGILSNLKDAFELSRSRAASVEMVRAMIRLNEPQDAFRTYGPTHPQASDHGRRLHPDGHKLWSARGRTA